MAKKPDFQLKAKLRNGVGQSVLGAGWLKPDGSINLLISPGAVLSWELSQQAFITLFPVNQAAPPSRGYQSSSSNNDDDDVPIS